MTLSPSSENPLKAASHRLILIRHAQARQDFDGRDKERTLTPEGHDQGKALAKFVSQIVEDAPRDISMRVSPALRTRETAQYLAEVAPDVPITYDERLYNAQAETILDVVRSCDEALSTLVLVGHNPALSDIAHAVTAQAPQSAAPLTLARSRFAPANACVIATESFWSTTDWRGCTLDLFFQPTKM